MSLSSPGVHNNENDSSNGDKRDEDEDDEDDEDDDPAAAQARKREEEFMAKQFENPDMQRVKEILTNPAKYKEVQRRLAINNGDITGSSSSEDDVKPPPKKAKSASKAKLQKSMDSDISLPLMKGRPKSIIQESMEVKKGYLDLKREKISIKRAKLDAEARRSENEFRLREQTLANQIELEKIKLEREKLEIERQRFEFQGHQINGTGARTPSSISTLATPAPIDQGQRNAQAGDFEGFEAQFGLFQE